MLRIDFLEKLFRRPEVGLPGKVVKNSGIFNEQLTA